MKHVNGDMNNKIFFKMAALIVCLMIQSVVFANKDAELERIDSDFIAYKRYIDGQLAQGLITPSQAQTLFNLKLKKAESLRFMRKLELQDPALAIEWKDEDNYIERMRALKDKGQITEAEFEDRVQESKQRLSILIRQSATQRELIQQKQRGDRLSAEREEQQQQNQINYQKQQVDFQNQVLANQRQSLANQRHATLMQSMNQPLTLGGSNNVNCRTTYSGNTADTNCY